MKYRCYVLMMLMLTPLASASLEAMMCTMSCQSKLDKVLFVAKLNTLSRDQINIEFELMHDESVNKMALRLFSTRKYWIDLDKTLPCKYFIQHIKQWVNGSECETTPLLSEENLQYTLPLLELFINAPVKSLNLAFNNLSKLPAQIGELGGLEQLYLYGNNLTTLPDEIAQLKNLKKLNLALNDFTILPDIIYQLPNLKELVIDEGVIISGTFIRNLEIRRVMEKYCPLNNPKIRRVREKYHEEHYSEEDAFKPLECSIQ